MGLAPMLPLRRLHHTFKLRESWRGFLLFIIAAGCWIMVQHFRVDAMFAYDTYRVYDLAEEDVLQRTHYNDIASGGDLAAFLQSEHRGLVAILNAMAATDQGAVCPECAVGLTPATGDMHSLELADFICSDFDSQAGSSDYPNRDCVVDNELWAQEPSVSSAPCCSNATLALYSWLLMVEYEVNGREERSEAITLEQLAVIANNQDPIRIQRWVEIQISTSSDLIQIIISRNGRMAGVGFKASYIDGRWFPDVIQCWQEIWSQRYDDTYFALNLAWFIFFVIDAVHELQDTAYHIRLIYRQTHDRRGFDQLPFWRKVRAVLVAIAYEAGLPFLMFVELPSIYLPVVLELLHFRGALTVINFNLCVAITLGVMLARFFQEGQVLPAFQLLVLTIFRSGEQLSNFALIMLVTLLIATEMHVTVFGVYSSAYDDYGEALLTLFNQFANGGDFENEGEIDNSPFGYIFLYLFGQLVLFLVLSQFFIAILVAAWDSATELKLSAAAATQMPPGFRWRPTDRSTLSRLAGSLVFFTTGYSMEARTFGQHVKHALSHCVDSLTKEFDQRREQASQMWATEADALTQDEEDNEFLLEQGLASRHILRELLLSREGGLSEWSAEYVLAMIIGPPDLDNQNVSGVAKQLRNAIGSGGVEIDDVHDAVGSAARAVERVEGALRRGEEERAAAQARMEEALRRSDEARLAAEARADAAQAEQTQLLRNLQYAMLEGQRQLLEGGQSGQPGAALAHWRLPAPVQPPSPAATSMQPPSPDAANPVLGATHTAHTRGCRGLHHNAKKRRSPQQQAAATALAHTHVAAHLVTSYEA